MDNHLSLEPLLVDRIKSEIPEFRIVCGMADLAGIADYSQFTPAAYIIYARDNIGESAGNGAVQVVTQIWLIVITVRDTSDIPGGSGARKNAGMLISKTIESLAGWKPSHDFRPLVRANAPDNAMDDSGYLYYPLAFEARTITHARTS